MSIFPISTRGFHIWPLLCYQGTGRQRTERTTDARGCLRAPIISFARARGCPRALVIDFARDLYWHIEEEEESVLVVVARSIGARTRQGRRSKWRRGFVFKFKGRGNGGFPVYQVGGKEGLLN